MIERRYFLKDFNSNLRINKIIKERLKWKRNMQKLMEENSRDIKRGYSQKLKQKSSSDEKENICRRKGEDRS